MRDSPHLVMKIFQRADWSEIQAETYFARVMRLSTDLDKLERASANKRRIVGSLHEC